MVHRIFSNTHTRTAHVSRALPSMVRFVFDFFLYVFFRGGSFAIWAKIWFGLNPIELNLCIASIKIRSQAKYRNNHISPAKRIKYTFNRIVKCRKLRAQNKQMPWLFSFTLLLVRPFGSVRFVLVARQTEPDDLCWIFYCASTLRCWCSVCVYVCVFFPYSFCTLKIVLSARTQYTLTRHNQSPWQAFRVLVS